jgi:UPF0755 protein
MGEGIGKSLLKLLENKLLPSLLKKFILSIIVVIFLSALLGGFLVFRAKRNTKNQKIITKAPEITLTIIEGWNINEITKYLEEKKFSEANKFIEITKNFNSTKFPILASKPVNASLEGFLFPDTYQVYDPNIKNSQTNIQNPEKDLIEKMLVNFSQKFTSEMQEQALKKNFSIYQVLTLASIIEKETGRNAVTPQQKQNLDTERKIVSGIFQNRLKIGMALESDATINYITKKNNPTPTSIDLETESPYNTYKVKGLPPTPICNPSLSSILAVLYPAPTEYYFFLHKQPSGEVVYSKTFEEHIKNKFKYLK